MNLNSQKITDKQYISSRDQSEKKEENADSVSFNVTVGTAPFKQIHSFIRVRIL